MLNETGFVVVNKVPGAPILTPPVGSVYGGLKLIKREEPPGAAVSLTCTVPIVDGVNTKLVGDN